MTVTASPDIVAGAAGTATVTSNSSTATPSGQVGAVTYAWTKVSGGAITATAATAATCAFQGAGMVAAEIRTAVFKCTVTDSFGSADSNNVGITLERF